ncbi:protein trunk-like [Ruditapes philippinarum]|uniref:protein trunk-like n=1 Tax=Ruditapes philippinarum TaxID=129788 RepID=UPI00295BE6BE|nr:protein trunk-like [Ruditapes philippinarum]XP_060598990.1 protein trunk-like [Ruditapes philippinarum]XP_060598991.1 protein trunk-like [Ruditapes philippinarum]XP_060598992.1 protein trunk-like [Ruditapes philippinarum]
MKSRGCAQPLVTRLEPEFTCYLRGCIYPRSTHAMLLNCPLFKVRGSRKLLITILYIILLSSPTFAHPLEQKRDKQMDGPETTVSEDGNKITFHTTGCRALTTEELRTLMGGAFDETKMAYDDESMKRSSSLQSVITENDNDDIDDDIGNYLNDEADIEEISDNKESEGTISVQSRKYMRRKRDADENRNSINDNAFLYQNLLHDSISKRKSRQKRSNSFGKFHPAWECKKEKKWLHMKEGYFPTRIFDGYCVQKSCFFGMYTCNEVNYKIKVLKRDPSDACRPRPMTGNMTTYEETWTFIRQTVTVACECGTPSSRSKNSKKSRKRKKK